MPPKLRGIAACLACLGLRMERCKALTALPCQLRCGWICPCSFSGPWAPHCSCRRWTNSPRACTHMWKCTKYPWSIALFTAIQVPATDSARSRRECCPRFTCEIDSSSLTWPCRCHPQLERRCRGNDCGPADPHSRCLCLQNVQVLIPPVLALFSIPSPHVSPGFEVRAKITPRCNRTAPW